MHIHLLAWTLSNSRDVLQKAIETEYSAFPLRRGIFFSKFTRLPPIIRPRGWDIGSLFCSASLIAAIYAISCFTGSRYSGTRLYHTLELNVLSPAQNGRHFADELLKCILLRIGFVCLRFTEVDFDGFKWHYRLSAVSRATKGSIDMVHDIMTFICDGSVIW